MLISPLPVPSSGPNSYKLHQHRKLADSSNWWSHTSLISNTSPRDCYQFHYQIETQRLSHSIILGIDPFQVNPFALLNIMVLPESS